MSMYLKTANFLVTRGSKPFKWGEWDCNLFVTEWLDHCDGGNRSAEIKGQYDNRKNALRFQNKYTSAPDFLKQNGFNLVEKTTEEFKDFDVILVQWNSYWSARIYFAGKCWSVIEDASMMVFDMEPGTYLVGEYNGR